MRNANHTRMTGRSYLTTACIVGDSPYPLGADGEEIVPIPQIPLSSPMHVHPHNDDFSTPYLTETADPWGVELKQLTGRLPAIGNLASQCRLESFMQHGVLSQVLRECKEFHVAYPRAYRTRTPQDVATVLFQYHAGIVRGIGPTTFPVGPAHSVSLTTFVRSLLEEPSCLFSEKDLSMLQSAMRACHEEQLDALLVAARGRFFLPSLFPELEAPPVSPSLEATPASSSLETTPNALQGLMSCYNDELDVPVEIESLDPLDPLDDFLFSSLPPTPVPQKDFEVEQILMHNRYGPLSKEIEFLCHFAGTDGGAEDLWLPIEKLCACSSILREYWRNTPTQVVDSTSPVIVPATSVPATIVPAARVTAARVPAATVRTDQRRRDGLIWSAQGKLTQSKVARRAFTDYCEDELTEILNTADQRALREWFTKYMNSLGKEATREGRVVGIVTQEQFSEGASYWARQKPHKNLKEAGLRMYEKRPALLQHFAQLCGEPPYEMVVAELQVLVQ